MKKIGFLLLFALGLFGCDWQDKLFDRSPAVVQVGKSRLTERRLIQMVPDWKTLSAEEQSEFLAHWLEEEMLYLSALDLKIDQRDDIALAIEGAKKKIVVSALITSLMDTVSISKKEVKAYYKEHPEEFLYGQYLWSGVEVVYPEWKLGDQFYKAGKTKVFDLPPKMPDYRIKAIEPFDSLTVSPDSCLVPDLREVEVGKLTGFKYCNRGLRSLIVLSMQDSSSVRPFEEVENDAALKVLLQKRREMLRQFKEGQKRKIPVFSDWKPAEE